MHRKAFAPHDETRKAKGLMTPMLPVVGCLKRMEEKSRRLVGQVGKLVHIRTVNLLCGE